MSFRTCDVFMSSNPWHNPVNSGSMTPLCYVTMNHEKSIHVDFCGYPKNNRDLLTWSTHFRTNALTSKRSFKAVCHLQRLPKMIFVIHHFGPSNSGHFFLEKYRKCSNFFKHFLGDIGYSPSFRWILGRPHLDRSRRRPRFFGIQTGPVSVALTNCTVDRRVFFSVGKLFKTGSKWVPTDIHATCFRRKSCSSVQVKDVLCPTRWLEQCSCFNFEMQTFDFQTARIQGASQGI